ncbi:hypothetical protein L6164_013701 [Bauhinia variegata]|uniref:Uncharacterized protein n=1 Tax=Bauhinia variegata TaxID=167791 RepID=A0ACB9NGE3_BAUVA|nr:hypothetical protein L6164_013701 [Bauhinia variegata]
MAANAMDSKNITKAQTTSSTREKFNHRRLSKIQLIVQCGRSKADQDGIEKSNSGHRKYAVYHHHHREHMPDLQPCFLRQNVCRLFLDIFFLVDSVKLDDALWKFCLWGDAVGFRVCKNKEET